MYSPPLLEVLVSTTQGYLPTSEIDDPERRQREARLHIVAMRKILQSEPDNQFYYNLLVEDICTALFGSNQIESVGATISINRQVCEEVFHRKRVRSSRYSSDSRPIKEELQHALAFKYLVDAIVFAKEPWTEQLLMNTHKILFEGLNHPASDLPWTVYGGKYRNGVTHPYDPEMDFEKFEENMGYTPSIMVPSMMAQMLDELNQHISKAENGGDVDPFWLASEYCVRFMRIHPFLGGNGRIGRIILNAILLKYSLVVISLGNTEEDRQRYLDIKTRVLSEGAGPGELATMVAEKAADCLNRMREEMIQVEQPAMVIPEKSRFRTLESIAPKIITL